MISLDAVVSLRFARMISGTVVAAALFMLSACAGLMTDSDALRVNLSGLQVLEVRLLEQRFLADIRIQNRSWKPLDVEGFSFDLDLNGKKFVSGVSNRHVTIEALSDAVLSVNLTGTLFGLIRQMQAFQNMEGKPFRYAFSGVLYTKNSPFGIAYSDEGEIGLEPEKSVEQSPSGTGDSNP
ncbi:LEA type 2 family protein [Thiolapillus sp.]